MHSIHQEVVFDASAKQLYEVLTGTESFSRMTGGAPTQITGVAGGSFSCFGGMISGINVECVPNERLVQAWRVKNWGPGVYSLVRVELRDEGNRTRLVLDHTGYPEDQGVHLDKGWHANYWEPLRKLLAA